MCVCWGVGMFCSTSSRWSYVVINVVCCAMCLEEEKERGEKKRDGEKERRRDVEMERWKDMDGGGLMMRLSSKGLCDERKRGDVYVGVLVIRDHRGL